MKIACLGSHGAGKSTLSYQLADYFKRRNKNVYVVHERVRHSPFPLNSESNYKTTIWAFCNQVTKELEAAQRGYDTVICDRSVFDCFIYASYFNFQQEILESMRNFALEWLRSYDFFFFVRPNMPCNGDGIRDIDEKFRDGIDNMFEEFFHMLLLPNFVEVYTSQIIKKELNFDDIFKRFELDRCRCGSSRGIPEFEAED